MLSVLYTAIAAELLEMHAYVVPLVGELHVRKNDPPPRMIFVPEDVTPGPPEGPGGNPRPLATLMKATEVFIHGRTTDHVEGMLDQLMIAVHKACKKASPGKARAGRYAFSKGKWTRNAALHGVNGLEMRITFAVAYPVVDRKWKAPDFVTGATEEPTPETYTGHQADSYPLVDLSGPEARVITEVGIGADVDPVEIDIKKE